MEKKQTKFGRDLFRFRNDINNLTNFLFSKPKGAQNKAPKSKSLKSEILVKDNHGLMYT